MNAVIPVDLPPPVRYRRPQTRLRTLMDGTAGKPRQARQTKAQRPRVFEVVRDQIRHELDSGALKPGDRLASERDLASRFGVSRAAVREAFRSLEMSGVLQFTKGAAGGAIVRQGSTDGVERSIRDMVVIGNIPLADLTETRSCLLGTAARLAASRATDADIHAIAVNIDATEALLQHEDPLDSVAAISTFYILLGEASHNLLLAMLIESVTAIVRDLLTKIRLKATMDMISPRRRLLAHLRAGDGAAAEQEIQSHLVELTRFIADRVAMPEPGEKREKGLLF